MGHEKTGRITHMNQCESDQLLRVHGIDDVTLGSQYDRWRRKRRSWKVTAIIIRN
jgi:hypothetical protein